MKPEWFKTDNIPYTSMWSGDEKWMPLVLEGKEIKGCFVFKEGDELDDFEIGEKSN